MPNSPMADSPALLSADRLDELVKLVQLVKLKIVLKYDQDELISVCDDTMQTDLQKMQKMYFFF